MSSIKILKLKKNILRHIKKRTMTDTAAPEGKYIKIDGVTYRRLKPKIVKRYKLNDKQKQERNAYMRAYRSVQQAKKLRGCLVCEERAAAAAAAKES